MCIKTKYYNTYVDGSVDQTERVDACSAGFLCDYPKTDKVYRTFNCLKSEVPTMQGHTSLYDRRGRPPTPRSISPPSSRGSDADRKHRRRSSIYLSDPIQIVRDTKPYAPQPPSPIPFTRSSTMPHRLSSPPSRGRAPIIIADPAPRYHTSATIPIGPVEVLEHSSPRRRSSRRDSVYLSPDLGRRSSRSPQGYASAEDEREREDRRRRRREHKTQANLYSSSVPTRYINGDGYASSYDSSIVDPSPAASAVKKELRWDDIERRRQNDKISSRPKLPRTETLRQSKAATEVKSILKNPSVSPSGRVRASSKGEVIDDLYRSMEGLGIRDRETSAQRMAREDRERADEAQKNRLSRRFDMPGPDRRFSMPPRSYTMGSGGRRREEIFYPDQRTYRTQQW